ncbi:histidine kinase dimerization/phosphoacceptor domain -containing protein [Phenylobacterium terrae]|uniref:Histidine kinase dimerization/phosphoacceptor domain -containing protein n=1 Tax=Phenylobacterium terrae TaxID=2665495 RepID=A0ABW4N1S2_9CAUL
MTELAVPELDLTQCDREPIHIPGAVQPHGALVVVDRATLRIEQAGGGCAQLLGSAPESLLGRLVTDAVPAAAGLSLDEAFSGATYAGALPGGSGGELDCVVHSVGDKLVLEFEAAPARRRSAAEMARTVETIGSAFGAARTLSQLADIAAARFRELTGFDRVMVYRFLPDETGSVIAEARADALEPFLNHRYPASDIPRQARQLYLRNVIRVIPDVGYAPSPLLAQDLGEPPLDMSDAHLRSVSPIHIQYLKNMGVAASASVSIIRDGQLWGLVALHHRTPRGLSFDDRSLCRLLAASLSHQIASLEDAELYRERLRSRAAEDALFSLLARGASVDEALESHAPDLLEVVRAHGAAVRHGDKVTTAGLCPDPDKLLTLADWLLERPEPGVFATDSLSRIFPAASVYPETASGLLAVTVSTSDRRQLLWFRAEQVEEINWAGNPHKPVDAASDVGALTPRKSFDLWRETVRGRAQPWSSVEAEAAGRIARTVAELQRTQSIARLNESLRRALDERDQELSQKSHLLREGDHRIQNSLQIVGGMLRMQLRTTTDPDVKAQLEEALSRVSAVALVHRRLHRSEHPETVDLDVYVRELLADIGASLGAEWTRQMKTNLNPVSTPTEMAMSIGLVLSELVLNAAKYAYEGGAGPLQVDLVVRGPALRLEVRDWGRGEAVAKPVAGGGLGSRLIGGLIDRLKGTIDRSAAAPGLRVVVTVPLPAGARGPGA